MIFIISFWALKKSVLLLVEMLFLLFIRKHLNSFFIAIPNAFRIRCVALDRRSLMMRDPLFSVVSVFAALFRIYIIAENLFYSCLLFLCLFRLIFMDAYVRSAHSNWQRLAQSLKFLVRSFYDFDIDSIRFV